MVKDITWKSYFADNSRYADIINGIGCKGRQVLTKDDLCELDTQVHYGSNLRFVQHDRPKKNGQKTKIRDMVRRAAFGVNFAIIGIENQEIRDYSIPLRAMEYDIGEYSKQAASIRRDTRQNHGGTNDGEYLYGFRKNSKLNPVVTFILYSGEDEWNAPETLHEMLDFTNIPDELREMTPDYRINLVEIRKLKDTSVFKTDIRQVFDFIRYSGNKEKLKELVEQDEYYRNMEQDAFDVVVNYTNAKQLIGVKKYYREDGKVDMCRALTELIEDGRAEGIVIGRNEGRREGRREGIDEKTRTIVHNMLERNMSIEDICAIAECSEDFVKEISK